jgi:hypothetical protein
MMPSASAAEHPLGALAADHAGLEQGSVRQQGSRKRDRRQPAGRNVWSSTDDRQDAPAGVDPADPETVGGGVCLHGQDPAHRHGVEEAVPVDDRIDGQTHLGQGVRQFGSTQSDRCIFFEPA